MANSTHYTHISHEERCCIYALLQSNRSISFIAKQLGHAESMIHSGQKGYRPKQAQRLAIERGYKAHACSKRIAPFLPAILEKLQCSCSPEQISGWVKM